VRRAIEGASASDGEALQATNQLTGGQRLDDQMNVIGLNGEMENAEVSTAGNHQRIAERAEHRL